MTLLLVLHNTLAPLVVTAPVISPNGGDHIDSVTVTLTTQTSGASIYYTLDGSTPSVLKTLYVSPFAITSNKTLKAIAIRSGYIDSDITTAAFTITPTPTPQRGQIGRKGKKSIISTFLT